MQNKSSEDFLLAALKIGQSYLAYGGSISHLENCLTEAGTARSFNVSVHATPVSLAISCINDETGFAKSLLMRIPHSAPHLSKLVFSERILSMFAKGAFSPSKLLYLVTKTSRIKTYSVAFSLSSIFLVGASSSYSRSFDLICAIIGGAITAASYGICLVFRRYFFIQDTLKEFFLCFISISASIILSSYLNLHPSQLFIGTLALVLPGLTLTSAVGDLIEDNLQTGLVKLAKAALALLSMGVAYILAVEVTRKMGFESLPNILSNVESSHHFVASLLSNLGMIMSFCLLLRVPKRAIFRCLMIGSSGWIIFHYVASAHHPFAASFISALVISILARISAITQRMVFQVFVVPSILVLVPGLLAFAYLQPILDEGSVEHAVQSVLSSVLIASSLSFGLLLGQIKIISRSTK